jgi:hypothetical protein
MRCNRRSKLSNAKEQDAKLLAVCLCLRSTIARPPALKRIQTTPFCNSNYFSGSRVLAVQSSKNSALMRSCLCSMACEQAGGRLRQR